MSRSIPASLEKLLAVTESRTPLGENAPPEAWIRSPTEGGAAVYANRNDRLNIDFTVDRLTFPEQQVMDPRLLRIAPGKNNELHKHAHETLFVILSGEGEVRVGESARPVKAGDVAFVPRWIFHQTRNLSHDSELVILAVTDFGFTSALLGDYDQRTRLAADGADVKPD